MHRVYIIGGPGSGKTTLSHRVAAMIPAPLYELDNIGYENGAGAQRSLSVKLQDIHAIAESDAWIVEGIFLWWTERLAERAEVIVWLDVPWRLALWRIISRHVKASVAGTNKHGGLGNLRFFLRGAKSYYQDERSTPQALDDDRAVTRVATKQVLNRYGSKLVHCRSGADVSSFLRSLDSMACWIAREGV